MNTRGGTKGNFFKDEWMMDRRGTERNTEVKIDEKNGGNNERGIIGRRGQRPRKKVGKIPRFTWNYLVTVVLVNSVEVASSSGSSSGSVCVLMMVVVVEMEVVCTVVVKV